MLSKFWKNKNEFEELEKIVKKAPSPANFAELITQYQNAGENDKAMSVCNQAIYYFPDSEEICDLFYRLKKKQVQPQIDALKNVIETKATALAFSQLAEIYKDLNDQETALQLCHEATKSFPNDDATYLVIGELRIERYYQTLQEKNGRLAIESLERAQEINPRNYRALLGLAKLYLQIGSITKAIKRLKSIQLFAPGDEEVKRLLQIAAQTKKPPHEDVDILLQNVEQEGRLFYNLEQEKVTPPKPITHLEIFQAPLESLEPVNTVTCLLVCDRDGNLIAHHAKEGIDYNIYYEIASSIHQTAKNSTKQMDIGVFQHCQIEGNFGTLHIVALQDVVYIVFGVPEVKPNEVYKELQRFISLVYKKLHDFVG